MRPGPGGACAAGGVRACADPIPYVLGVGILDGRVAVITGAGRGIGREHALLFAAEGAAVVVNDLGGDWHGLGADAAPARQVVHEIQAGGGEAVANGEDAADFAGARRLIETAVERYGRLDVLVNNAGILRDRFLVNMSEDEWDGVVRVHLRGHFATLRHAAAHWRGRAKDGESFDAAVVNTASPVGLTLPNLGQINYAAAKAGIAAMTQVAAAGARPLWGARQLHRAGRPHADDHPDARARGDDGRGPAIPTRSTRWTPRTCHRSSRTYRAPPAP